MLMTASGHSGIPSGTRALEGKAAIVTGSTSGIGRGIATTLAGEGANVMLNGFGDAGDIERLRANLSAEHGVRVFYDAADMGKPEAITRMIDQAIEAFDRVDILVNNAGIARNTDAIATTDEEWRAIIDVDLNGVFYCARAFGKYMVEHGSGSVVNLGSMSGIIANKPQPQAAYNASKAAVHLLTKSLACEWASHNVRVNALAPGYVATEMTRPGREKKEWYSMWLEMTPMKRCAEPDEIASAALFLASDASSFITGSVLVVDGGYTAW